MPTTLPESVRESWGEPAADDFARWLDEYVQDHAVPRDEYREVLSRLDVLGSEVSGINERLDRMEERVEGRFDQMEERFEGRLNQMEERVEGRLDQMEEHFEGSLNQVEERFEGRLDQVEGRFDQIEERFEGRFDQMEGRFNQMEDRFNQMDQRIDRMHEQMRVMMRWTVGTIALFGTIVTVLLAIAEFAP